ncbi:MAG: hypothetical protein IJR66_00855 [Clostridia bacterium]|nr:hypothetical protein [Clostridia bacterium]
MPSDAILEPSKYYTEALEKQFEKSTDDFFEDLVKKSGVDREENRKTCTEYRNQLKVIDGISKQISKYRTLKVFSIIAVIFCFIAFFVSVFGMIGQNEASTVGILVAVLCPILAIVLIIFIVKKISPTIKDFSNKKEREGIKAKEILDRAYAQMRPLNDLFDSDMTRQLITKNVPILNIDRNFNLKRFDYLNGKYGLTDNLDLNESTTDVLSGEIIGNPFIITRNRVHRMGTETYHGSLVISWTERVRDSNGNYHNVTRTQTLVASVVKPKPFYHKNTTLIYGNEVAPDLSFSHTPSHAEKMSEKELERFFKNKSKKIHRKTVKSTTNSGGFTEMGNEEFDALFDGLDRDNEVQYRLMFTPLAQKNMLTLMKNPKPYGDDFYFNKRKSLNYISSEHSNSFDMNTTADRYVSYDIDISKKTFKDYNTGYFRALYFDFAPLLSIPLYQQHKPHEYIYHKEYKRNYTSYETEAVVNKFNKERLSHPSSKTESILKTQFIEKEGQSDKIEVTAYSYDTMERVDFVQKLGGDGRFHAVPVPWVEYIPVWQKNVVLMKELNLSDREFNNSNIYNDVNRNPIAYKNGMFATILNRGDNGFDAVLSKYINNGNLNSNKN